MRFGAHVSSAGGVTRAPENAAAIGCEVFQMFTRSPQGGPAPALTPSIVEAFRAACDAHALARWFVHAPYYLNFASADARIRANSARIVREELDRASTLGATYVMFHPGSARDVGEEGALAHCVDGIRRVLDGYDGSAQLLIEISAGAGMVIGDTFEELAELLARIDHPELGVCFDTAHAFASGYDLRTADAVADTFRTFDRIVGLARLRMSHCNDSLVDLSARKDRHEHLGRGYIGEAGFRALVHAPPFTDLDLVCETEPDGVAEDIALLKRLRDDARSRL